MLEKTLSEDELNSRKFGKFSSNGGLVYGEFDENGQIIQIENGNGVKIKSGSEVECAGAIRELENLEVTLPDITFELDEFDNIELTPEEIISIIPFINE